MNKAQLTVMGNVVWQGMDDAGLATRLATNLNNIDEVGKERIKEIVGKIPSKTSELTNDSGFLTEHQSLAEYAKTADVEANYQPKGDYLTEETDPVWNSEKGNYYDKEEIEGMFAQADATYQPKGNYATKEEIPSLDGYATESWVEGKGYLTEHQDISGKANVGDSYTKAESDAKYLTEHQSLEGYAKTADVNTELEKKQDVISDLDAIRDGAAKGATAIQEHQDISGKQDVITDLADIREGAALGKTALQSFTETDPTVPAHVKAITEEDIAKWNQGGGGEPDEYIKNAVTSEDGKTLTLSKKDGSEVVFSQNLDGYATEEWVGEQGYLTEHQPLKTINGESIVGDGNIEVKGGGQTYTIDISCSKYYENNTIYCYIKDKNGDYVRPKSVSGSCLGFSSGSYSFLPTITSTGFVYGFDSDRITANIELVLPNDETYYFVIDNSSVFQKKLTSGTNIKTINGESILGSGNIEISGGGGDETDPIWTAEKVNYYTKTEVDEMIGNINNALAKLING